MEPSGSTAQTATRALKPFTCEDPLFQLLRDGNVKDFNGRKSANPTVQLADCDFCQLDMRGLDAAGIDFSNSYFRGADRISGALFPAELGAEEIALSVNRGTLLRCDK